MNQSVYRGKEASHRYRKVFIDSKYRTSGTSSNFTVTLPEVLDMSHNHRFCVDDITLPRSWYNVGSSNKYVYVGRLYASTPNIWRAVLTEGDYDGVSLATELQNQLNSTSVGGTFSVSFNRSTGRLQVTNTSVAFILPSDDELVVLGNQGIVAIDATNAQNPYLPLKYKEQLRSCNYVCGNLQGWRGYNTLLVLDSPVDLNWLDVVYIHGLDFGSYNTLNLRGDKTIIKEVKVDGQPFSYVYDNANFGFDWMDCSNQSWGQLTFALRDKYGNEVNLNNRDVSFSLVLEDLSI